MREKLYLLHGMGPVAAGVRDYFRWYDSVHLNFCAGYQALLLISAEDFGAIGIWIRAWREWLINASALVKDLMWFCRRCNYSRWDIAIRHGCSQFAGFFPLSGHEPIWTKFSFCRESQLHGGFVTSPDPCLSFEKRGWRIYISTEP